MTFKKVTFQGNQLWFSTTAEEDGHGPLAHRDHVDESTGELDFTRCFQGDSYAHVYFDGEDGAGIVKRYHRVVGTTNDIREGWDAV